MPGARKRALDVIRRVRWKLSHEYRASKAGREVRERWLIETAPDVTTYDDQRGHSNR